MTISQLSAFRISRLKHTSEVQPLKALAPRQSECQTVAHSVNRTVCVFLSVR